MVQKVPVARPIVGAPINYGSLQTIEEGGVRYIDDPESLPPFVRFSERERYQPTMDRVCRVLFGVAAVLHVVICCCFLWFRNVCLSESDGICSHSSLRASMDRCQQTYLTPVVVRSLAATTPGASSTNPVFDLFSASPWIPLLVVVMVQLVAMLWMKALQSFATVVTWGTIILGCVIYIIFGVKTADAFSHNLGVAFIVYGVVLLLVSVAYLREDVSKSADRLRVASELLSQNKYILLSCLVVEACMLLMMALTWYAWVASYAIWTIEDTGIGCIVHVNPSNVATLRMFVVTNFVWLTLYFEGAKTLVTAMSIGTLLFAKHNMGQEESDYPFRALRCTVTSSVGTIAIGSLLTSIVEKLQENEKSRFWFLSVTGCVYRVFLQYCKEALFALNRYALVAHAFTGDGYFQSAQRSASVLKRNFTSAIVNDQIGVSVLQSGAKALSLCVVLFSWALLDSIQGLDSLGMIRETINGNILLFMLFVLLLLSCLRYPLVGILIIVGLSGVVLDCSASCQSSLASPIGAILLGCFARIIFNFQASVILSAIDTVFVCYAVGKDSKVKVANEKAYELVHTSNVTLL